MLQLHGFYYYEQDNRLSIDVVPDISVTDESAFAAMLTDDLQRLIPGVLISIVIDHNYSV